MARTQAKKTILLLGKNGQVGWELQRALAPFGQLIALDRAGQNGCCGDIGNLNGLRETIERIKPDVLVNAAGYTAVDQAQREPELAARLNHQAPALMAELMKTHDGCLVHYSTDYVFDGTATTPYEPDDAPAPQSVYGRTKLAGERAVLAELPTANVVRTAWVYTGTGTDFVATMRRLERERDVITVVDDQIGSPTYSRDLAAGLLEVAASPVTGSILHSTNAGTASWFDLARAVLAGVGADPERVRPCSSAEYVRPAPRPSYSVLSGAAWERAGLTPFRGWRDALGDALQSARPATT